MMRALIIIFFLSFSVVSTSLAAISTGEIEQVKSLILQLPFVKYDIKYFQEESKFYNEKMKKGLFSFVIRDIKEVNLDNNEIKDIVIWATYLNLGPFDRSILAIIKNLNEIVYTDRYGNFSTIHLIKNICPNEDVLFYSNSISYDWKWKERFSLVKMATIPEPLLTKSFAGSPSAWESEEAKDGLYQQLDEVALGDFDRDGLKEIVIRTTWYKTDGNEEPAGESWSLYKYDENTKGLSIVYDERLIEKAKKEWQYCEYLAVSFQQNCLRIPLHIKGSMI